VTAKIFRRSPAHERAIFSLSSTQQKFLGSFLVVHGFGHAVAAMWAIESGRVLFVRSLWELAMVGFVAAGFGAIGVAGVRDFWRPITVLASVASILSLVIAPNKVFVAGLVMDFTAIALVAYSRSPGEKTRPGEDLSLFQGMSDRKSADGLRK
jgi:hypothetical protein